MAFEAPRRVPRPPPGVPSAAEVLTRAVVCTTAAGTVVVPAPTGATRTRTARSTARVCGTARRASAAKAVAPGSRVSTSSTSGDAAVAQAPTAPRAARRVAGRSSERAQRVRAAGEAGREASLRARPRRRPLRPSSTDPCAREARPGGDCAGDRTERTRIPCHGRPRTRAAPGRVRELPASRGRDQRSGDVRSLRWSGACCWWPRSRRYDLAWLAPPALAVITLAWHGARVREGLFLGLLTGLAFFGVHVWWMNVVGDRRVGGPHHLLRAVDRAARRRGRGHQRPAVVAAGGTAALGGAGGRARSRSPRRVPLGSVGFRADGDDR